MYELNPNRRSFNFPKKDAAADKADKKLQTPNSYLPSGGLPERNPLSGKSYKYVTIKSSTADDEKNTEIREKFLYAVLITAMILAAVCTLLSIASAVMFFLI